jgi:hypothetical protein
MNLRRALLPTILALVGAASSVHAANVDVGVSVQISQPGIYGRIDIGRFPQPQVVVAQPVVIQRPVVVVAAPPEPVYLWVPPGHRKHWGKHCGRYNACGVPVYFVRDDWYDKNVQAGASKKHKGHGHGKGHKDD